MPLKRRSDAISRDQSESESEDIQTQPQRRRQRSSSASSTQSSASSVESENGHQNQEQTLTKKLVRLALSTEYSRTPLRRSDISTKVFKENNAHGRGFKAVFEAAQRILQDTFGMQLVELPSKEKTTLKDRRNQATQTKAPSGSSSKSWILMSTLPAELKTNPAIAQPSKAPTVETEASYTALYTFILSLIYLNNNALTDQKLNRYLKRVNVDTYTPFGSLDKLLQRLIREGYIEKRRDTSSGEEVIEWVPGPRGKVEVGMRGVTGLVRSVYGYGAVSLSQGRGRAGGARGSDDEEEENGQQPLVKIEEDELNAKLSRSLGIKVGETLQRNNPEQDADGEDAPAAETDQPSSRQRQRQSTRNRGRRARDDDDD